ncbi:G1/S-specific cyclin cln3 [Desmophyllum pertusum]|uniref:Battenin n=1 Tax=Desmophyllum pertusum TaxID=174260 RepID=A0A9W9ZLC1_9CNID|nr:G1/S-specific cyclin cln3 [Desmophyllum pertusum]
MLTKEQGSISNSKLKSGESTTVRRSTTFPSRKINLCTSGTMYVGGTRYKMLGTLPCTELLTYQLITLAQFITVEPLNNPGQAKKVHRTNLRISPVDPNKEQKDSVPRPVSDDEDDLKEELVIILPDEYVKSAPVPPEEPEPTAQSDRDPVPPAGPGISAQDDQNQVPTVAEPVAPETPPIPPRRSKRKTAGKAQEQTVLLADILPTLIIKITAPFYMQKNKYNIRIALCVLFAFASFFIVAFSHALWFRLLGVVCASISSGFGEITLLSYSAHFDKDVVSTWSSGTGAAGVFGALSYAGFASAGLSPRNTVLIMNVIPFTLGISYWFILEHPEVISEREPLLETERTDSVTGADNQPVDPLTIKTKLLITKSLLKYMLPLFFVYFAEYFINQGLHELIYWNRIWLTPSEQYRWYQVDYQIGVFISRSSVNIFPIKKIWLLALLQHANLVVLLSEAYFHFLPSVWIMFIIVLYEGLLGGACYVNAFYRISQEVPPEHREFSMGVASMADSCGIALAGAVALPTHNALCSYWRNKVSS